MLSPYIVFMLVAYFWLRNEDQVGIGQVHRTLHIALHIVKILKIFDNCQNFTTAKVKR